MRRVRGLGWRSTNGSKLQIVLTAQSRATTRPDLPSIAGVTAATPLSLRYNSCSSRGVQRAPLPVFFLVTAIAVGAKAQEESVSLDYVADPGCPDRTAFIDQVQARTLRSRFVEVAAGVRHFVVRVSEEEGHAVGRLGLGAGHEASERQVTGKTCADVVSALALITALAIDPSASTAPARRAESPPAAPPETNPLPAALGVSDASSRPTPGNASSNKAARDATTHSMEGAGVRGQIASGFTSGALTLFGGSLYGEVGFAGAGAWAPSVRASLVAAASAAVRPTTTETTGAAYFTMLAGRLGICPLRVRMGDSLALRPCVSAEVGRLKGSGQEGGFVTRPEDQSILRLAVGETAEFELKLGGAAYLELELGMFEPVSRRRFVFTRTGAQADTVVVAVTPALEGLAGLGVGVHFP